MSYLYMLSGIAFEAGPLADDYMIRACFLPHWPLPERRPATPYRRSVWAGVQGVASENGLIGWTLPVFSARHGHFHFED